MAKIASIVRVEQPKLKGTVVSILDLETGNKDYAIHTDNQKFVLLSLQWANDTTLLISAKFPANRYGTPTTETRLVKYDLTTRKPQAYSPVASSTDSVGSPTSGTDYRYDAG